MKNFFCSLIPAFIMILSFGAGDSHAQVLEFGIGWYTGIDENATHLSSSSSQWTMTGKQSYFIGLLANRFLESEKTSRFGLRYAMQSATAKPLDQSRENHALRDGITYRMYSISLDYQRKLYDRAQLLFVLDFAGGLTLFSSRLKSGLDYCDSPFCNLPGVNLNLTPGLLYMLQFNKHVAVELRGSYCFLLGNKEEAVPFQSGLRFVLGVNLESSEE